MAANTVGIPKLPAAPCSTIVALRDAVETAAQYKIKVAVGEYKWVNTQKDSLGGTLHVIHGGHGFFVYPGYLSVRCVFALPDILGIKWSPETTDANDVNRLMRNATHVFDGKCLYNLLDPYPAGIDGNSMRKCRYSAEGAIHDAGCSDATHRAGRDADLAKVGLLPGAELGLNPKHNNEGEKVAFFGVNGEVQDGVYVAGKKPGDTPGYCWTACFDVKIQQALAMRYGPWLTGRVVHSLMIRNPFKEGDTRWTLSEISTDTGTRLHVDAGETPGLPSYSWAQLAMRLYLCTDSVGGFVSVAGESVRSPHSHPLVWQPGYCYLALVKPCYQNAVRNTLGAYPAASAVAQQLADSVAINGEGRYVLSRDVGGTGRSVWHVEQVPSTMRGSIPAHALLSTICNSSALVGAPSFADGGRFCCALAAAARAQPYEYLSLGGVLIGGGAVGPWQPDWYGGKVIGSKDQRWQATALFAADSNGKYSVTEAYYYVSGFVESALTACMGAFVDECGSRGLLPDPDAVQRAHDAQLATLADRIGKVEHEVFGQGLSGVGCLGYVLAEAGIATSSKVRRLDELSDLHLAQFRLAVHARGGIYVRYKGQEDSFANHLTWTNQVVSETLGLVRVGFEFFEEKMHVSWYATTVFNPRARTGLADKVSHIEDYLLSHADDLQHLQTIPRIANAVDATCKKVDVLERTLGADVGYDWRPNQLAALWRGMAIMCGRSGSRTWTSRDVKWPRCASNKNMLDAVSAGQNTGSVGEDEAQYVHTASDPHLDTAQQMQPWPTKLRTQLTLRGLSERLETLHSGLTHHADGEYALRITDGQVTAMRLSPGGHDGAEVEPSYCRERLMQVDSKLDPFCVQNLTPDRINVNWSSVNASGQCTPGAHLILGLEDIDRPAALDVESDAVGATAGLDGNGAGDAQGEVANNDGGDADGGNEAEPAAPPPAPPRVTSNLQLSNRIKTLMAAALMMAYANGDMHENYGVKRMIASALVGAVAMTEDVKEALSHGQRDRGWINDYDNLNDADARLDMIMRRMDEIMGGTEYHHRELVCTRLMGVNSAVFNYWDQFPAVHS